jgi:hypothetical protein
LTPIRTMPSMKPKRTHIAAAGTMVALGALAAVAIGAGAGEPAKTVSVPRAQPVEVRTVVVHRTVHVVRHQKPKKQKPVAAPPAPAATSRPVQIAQAPASQPTYQPVATTPAPAAEQPLKTATSGGGGEHKDDGGEHEHEHEHEGGGDD